VNIKQQTITSTLTTQARDLPSNGIGAIVFGGDFQGLGIVRSLGRHGVPVCIVDDQRSIAPYSRYTTHAVRVANLRDEKITVQTALELARRLDLKGWVLYPTRDETVAAFSLNKAVLSKWFRVPTAEWSAVECAWDKRQTYTLTQKLGIASPRTWFPRSIEDLRQITADFPLVIKPAIKEHFIYTTKVKAWRVDSREELVDRFQQAATFVPPEEIMIQELIPGGSENLFGYCAFFKEHRALGTMVAQYKRQHPPQFGRSCTHAETIELPILEEIAQRFLRAINYYGLVEMEFKQDPRTGDYKLLDVNARTWGYHALGLSAGVNFARMLFEDQLGKTVQTVRARAGVTWIRLVTDLPVGILGVIRRQWGLRNYLKSVTRFSTESVFSFNDPIPSMVETALLPYFYFKKGY
jgi:D-aspartate ligase